MHITYIECITQTLLIWDNIMHKVLKVHDPEWVMIGSMWDWNLGYGFRLVQWVNRNGHYEYALSFSNGRFEPIYTTETDDLLERDIDKLDEILMRKMFRELHDSNQRIGEYYDNFLTFIKREFPEK